MTSPDVPAALLRDLDFGGDARSGLTRFAFAQDFDSTLAFPDLPFDPASPDSRYDAQDRHAMRDLLATAAGALDARVPQAGAFVDRALDRVLIRRTDAIASATSSSNRDHVGVCVLTNMHEPAERVLSTIEALVHEAIHQHLYRVEQATGHFCSLDATRRFRSPWSGNRIPLHSLVHACFVYFGLLGLWSRYARTATDPREAAFVRDRIARSLFGFAFVGGLLDDATFPRDRVDPRVLDAIHRVAAGVADAGVAAGPERSFGAALDDSTGPAWSARVAAAVAHASA